MSDPKVSVLLPVRDAEEFLGEALASLSTQTLADHEVIVVDDGSEDESVAVAEAHARSDRRVRVVRQGRLGVVAAAERARAEARAPLLARMDADDVALPERLELQAAALADEKLAACGGGVEFFPAASQKLRAYEAWLNSLVTVEAAARDAFVECPLPHPTLMSRAEVTSYRDCGWPEDYDLVLRLWAGGHMFRNVDLTVLRWRDHGRRLTWTSDAFSLQAFTRCKVHHLRETLLARDRAAVVWGAGPTGKAFARELLRRRTPLVAFLELDPRKLGKQIHGAPVVHIDRAADFSGALVLGAVAGAGNRARVRAQAAALGLREGRDFVAVA